MTVVLAFAAYRFSLVINQDLYYTIEETFEYHFDDSDKISLEKNRFAIAARITDFTPNTNGDSIEDESYGTVQFWIKWWDGVGT